MAATSEPFCERRYLLLSAGILALAGFNLTFRLGQEFVTQWDESLYAISAWEALEHRSWIGTTFLGVLDYYNTKPPLMVWLIAAAFHSLEPTLVSLRIASVLSAWITIAVLQRWAHRLFGATVALLAGVVLSTTFAFIHVHAGRSATTDAPFTLVVLLTVVTLSSQYEHSRRRLWLGPLLAAAFLLRGMAVLMPVSLVVIFMLWRWRDEKSAWPLTLAAAAIGVALISMWMLARFMVDGWAFLSRLFLYDFLARSVTPIEGHPGGPLYYANILQKHHYDWLSAAAVALLIFPLWRGAQTAVMAKLRAMRPLFIAWGGATVLVPTVMQTKVPWYLNSFYPLFALAVAVVLAHAFSVGLAKGQPRYRVIIVSVLFLLALGLAETKLIWYSFHIRDIRLSPQGIMLAERSRLHSRRLFLAGGNNADRFVADAVVRAEPRLTRDEQSFLEESTAGDFLLISDRCESPQVRLTYANGRFRLCERLGVTVEPTFTLVPTQNEEP